MDQDSPSSDPVLITSAHSAAACQAVTEADGTSARLYLVGDQAERFCWCFGGEQRP